nr:hypothetical protein [Prolixibacteraceae bacterium]
MKVKFFLASIISGILLALAWSALGGLILLIAFVPLLWLDNYFTQNKSNYVSIIFWYYAFLSFLTWNMLAAWWIWIVTPSGALFILITNSFLMSLVWLLVHEIRRSRGDKLANFMLILAWITFEYLHYHWDLSWPWLTLGNGFANSIKLIQWYELTGVFGGSLWVLAVNLLVWNIVKKHQYKRKNFNYAAWIRLLFVVILPIVASATRYRLYAEEGDVVNVVIAQPNIDPYEEKFSGMKFEEQYDRILDAFDSLGSYDVDFFIAPETAFHNVWLNHTSNSIPIKLSRDFINNSYPASAIVVGALTCLEYDDKEHSSSTARYSVDDSIFYDVFNSALYI